jgi:uncharacterized repeat protein (TIGR01451 family)
LGERSGRASPTDLCPLDDRLAAIEHVDMSSPVRQTLQKILFCMILAGLILLSLLGRPPAPVYALPAGYQEYYVLGNETQVLEMFRVIQNRPDLASMSSVITIVATADHQIVYYDHWEDGYEPDILAPIQATTQVYGEAGSIVDTLSAGDIISLNSDGSGEGLNDFVSVPRGTDLRYDGSDRLLSIGGPIDVVHSLWSEEDIFVGGAWEVYPTGAWATGYSYIVPIGEDLYQQSSAYFPDLQHVWLEIQAIEDNTTVHIDNGNEAISIRLDRGQTYSSMGFLDGSTANVPEITVLAGTTLLANKPIQGGLGTGRRSNQTRFYTLVPDADWGTEYVAPIPRTNDRAAEVYLYNPDVSSSTVTAHDALTPPDGTTFTLEGRTPRAYRHPSAVGRYVPAFSALRLYSSGPLWAVASADAGQAGYDWGFSFVPTRFAGREYYVSWAPGIDDAGNPNASPVWVSPLSDNVLFSVDYSQPTIDGVPDQSFVLDSLQMHRVYDPDGDNTGMHIQADKPFVAIWGEDPSVAHYQQGKDMGYPVLPLDGAWQDRVITLHKTPKVQTLAPDGGIVTFTLRAEAGAYLLNSVQVTDTLPLPWTYVTGSTLVTSPDGSTTTREPEIEGQDLSWPLDASLHAHQSLTITFQARLADPGPLGEARYDDMESADLSGGIGWSSPWTEDESGCSTDCVANTTDTTHGSPHSGDYHLSLSETGAVSRAADLSGFQQPVLRFWRRLDPMGAGDRFVLRLFDGTAWTTVRTFGPGDEPGHYAAEQLDLGRYRSARFALQIAADGANTSGYIYLDDVEILDAATTSTNVAQATAIHRGRRFSSRDQATVLLSPLHLSQSVDRAQTRAGDDLTYTLTYTNSSQSLASSDRATSGATLSGVVIRDVLPANTTFVSASPGYTYLPGAHTVVWGRTQALALPPGSSGTLTATVSVHEWTRNGQILSGQGYIDSEQTPEIASNPVETVVQAPEMALVKSGPSRAAPDQVILYTIAYTNTGPITATGVLVTDIIPTFTAYQANSLALDTGSGYVPLSDAVDDDAGQFTGGAISVRPGQFSDPTGGQIGPGESGRIRFAVRVGSAVPVGNDIANYATLSRDYARPQNSALLLTAVSDLTLEKTANRDLVSPGEMVSYTITVGGSGSLAPTQVYVHDAIPLYTGYVPGTAVVPVGFELYYSADYGRSWSRTPPADPSQVTHLRWYAPLIGAGVRVPLGYAVQVQEPLPASNRPICNQARAWSTQTPQLDSNQVCVPTLDLDLATAYDGPTVVPGRPITFTLSYGNYGSATARDVTLTNIVPGHTMFDPGASTPGWTCPVGAQAGTLCTLVAGDLATGSSRTVTFTVHVTDPLPAGVAAITNQAYVSSRYGPGISDTISIPVTADAELLALKSNGVTMFHPGDILTYTIALRNVGNQGASGIVLTDTLPDYTTLISGTVSHGGVYLPTDRQIVWTMAAPLTGKTDIVRTVQLQVDDPLPDYVAQITNTVLVSDDGANGDTPAGNVAIDVDTLDFVPALRIAKHGPAHAEVGDTVFYTFTVSTVSFTPTSARANAIGDGSPIRDVRVSDSRISPVHYVRGDDGDGVLEIGEVWVYTASYRIRDADRGRVVNIGTATGKDVNGETVTATSTHTMIVAGQTLYLPLIVRND